MWFESKEKAKGGAAPMGKLNLKNVILVSILDEAKAERKYHFTITSKSKSGPQLRNLAAESFPEIKLWARVLMNEVSYRQRRKKNGF